MKSQHIERTLVVLKPDAVKRGLIGEIIRRFEQRGLKIVGMKMVWVGDEHVEKHYEAHKGKPFFEKLVGFLKSGPVVAMVIEGVHAVEVVRKIVGPTDPSKAPPGTIRGDYAHISTVRCDEKGIAIPNLFHASRSKEEAEKEISLWFKPEEIYDYKLVHEEFTL
jgi:nucleoside-diphosphate kinase